MPLCSSVPREGDGRIDQYIRNGMTLRNFDVGNRLTTRNRFDIAAEYLEDNFLLCHH